MLSKDATNYPLLIIDKQDSYNYFFWGSQFKSNDFLMIEKDACFWGYHKFIPECWQPWSIYDPFPNPVMNLFKTEKIIAMTVV